MVRATNPKPATTSLFDLIKPKKLAIQGESANKLFTFLMGVAPDLYLRGVEAEITAELMRQADGDETDILDRLRRIEDIRKADRLASIGEKAALHVSIDSDPTQIDPNWRQAFRAKASQMLDQEMEGAWGRILASEANQPGSYSLRTISIVADMTKEDAELFATVCGYAWHIEEANSPHVAILGNTDDNPDYPGISFLDLNHLASLGLLTSIPHIFRFDSTEMLRLSYCGREQLHINGQPGCSINLGIGALTRPGSELAQIVDVEPVPEFVDHCIKGWESEMRGQDVTLNRVDS